MAFLFAVVSCGPRAEQEAADDVYVPETEVDVELRDATPELEVDPKAEEKDDDDLSLQRDRAAEKDAGEGVHDLTREKPEDDGVHDLERDGRN